MSIKCYIEHELLCHSEVCFLLPIEHSNSSILAAKFQIAGIRMWPVVLFIELLRYYKFSYANILSILCISSGICLHSLAIQGTCFQ